MAKLHLPGDWSPPLIFALAGAGTTLKAFYGSAEYTVPGQTELGLALLAMSFLFTIAAFKGREIQNTSVYYYWKALETSLTVVIFSTLLVFFGSNFLLMNFVALVSKSYRQTAQTQFSFWILFLGLGFLTFAYYFSLHARITVFNKDKSFLTMIGKPWSFTRRNKAGDFKELVMTTSFSYAGSLGMMQYWRRHFYIFAVNGKKNVLLMRDDSLEEAKISLKKLSRLTGLPAAKIKLEMKPLAPDLRVEIGKRKSLDPIMQIASQSIGTLAELQKKFPTAQVLNKVPPHFPSGRKKQNFDSDHFIELLKVAKIPYYFHGSTTIQEDIWYFKNPLIVPLKFLDVFDESGAVRANPSKAYIVFTGTSFPWKEFGWEPDKKYPPIDADEDTKWWWGRQGKDV